jgi:hypothetical protein
MPDVAEAVEESIAVHGEDGDRRGDAEAVGAGVLTREIALPDVRPSSSTLARSLAVLREGLVVAPAARRPLAFGFGRQALIVREDVRAGHPDEGHRNQVQVIANRS